MKSNASFLVLLSFLLPLLGHSAESAEEAEDAGKKSSSRLISTTLSGREVGFVRTMAGTSLLLRDLAVLAAKDVQNANVADFAGSMQNALEEELTGLETIARAQSISLPEELPEAQRAQLKELRTAGLPSGKFLAEVIRLRSDQLRAIQEIESTQSQPIRNFAGAMVKTIQDELVFIQLLSTKVQKNAGEAPTPGSE